MYAIRSYYGSPEVSVLATHRRRIAAPSVFETSCGATVLPLDFDILRPSPSRITSYNVCYTKLLRVDDALRLTSVRDPFLTYPWGRSGEGDALLGALRLEARACCH